MIISGSNQTTFGKLCFSHDDCERIIQLVSDSTQHASYGRHLLRLNQLLLKLFELQRSLNDLLFQTGITLGERGRHEIESAGQLSKFVCSRLRRTRRKISLSN